MNTPRIDALDLRDPAVVARQGLAAWLDELDKRDLWVDWNAIGFDWPSYGRRVTFRYRFDTRALQRAMRAATRSMSGYGFSLKKMVAAAADAQSEALKLQAITGAKPPKRTGRFRYAWGPRWR